MLKTLLAPLVLAAAAALTTAQARPSQEVYPVQFTKRQSSTYPATLQTPPQSSLKQEWIDALNAATAAGKIPNISPSTVNADGSISYPNGIGSSKDTCNWTISKCLGARDISSVPDHEWTISFDDGPTGASTALYDFLHQNNQAGTHFMVGYIC